MKKIICGLALLASTAASAQERDGSIIYEGPMPHVVRSCSSLQNPAIGYAIYEGAPRLLAVFEPGRAGKWLELEDLGDGVYQTRLQYVISSAGIYDATGTLLGYCRTS